MLTEFIKLLIELLTKIFLRHFGQPKRIESQKKSEIFYLEKKLIYNYLTVNKYSRPGIMLKKPKGIIIHWTEWPMCTAQQVTNDFENKKAGKNGYGSSHLTNDLNGDIVVNIPFEIGSAEVAYHAGESFTLEAKEKLGRYPNTCTIGIENCVMDWGGRMTNETYKSLVLICVFLCGMYNLSTKNIWLHWHINKKKCHKWFVEDLDKWNKFLDTVDKELLKI